MTVFLQLNHFAFWIWSLIYFETNQPLSQSLNNFRFLLRLTDSDFHMDVTDSDWFLPYARTSPSYLKNPFEWQWQASFGPHKKVYGAKGLCVVRLLSLHPLVNYESFSLWPLILGISQTWLIVSLTGAHRVFFEAQSFLEQPTCSWQWHSIEWSPFVPLLLCLLEERLLPSVLFWCL